MYLCANSHMLLVMMLLLLLLLSGEAKFEAIVEIIQNNFYMYNYLSYELCFKGNTFHSYNF